MLCEVFGSQVSHQLRQPLAVRFGDGGAQLPLCLGLLVNLPILARDEGKPGSFEGIVVAEGEGPYSTFDGFGVKGAGKCAMGQGIVDRQDGGYRHPELVIALLVRKGSVGATRRVWGAGT